jgi:hypothetical protein
MLMDRLMREIWEESSYKDVIREKLTPELLAKLMAELDPEIKAEIEAEVEAKFKLAQARETIQAALLSCFDSYSEDMLEPFLTDSKPTLEAVIASITNETLEQVRDWFNLY